MRLVKCDAPDEHEPLTLVTDSRKEDMYYQLYIIIGY